MRKEDTEQITAMLEYTNEFLNYVKTRHPLIYREAIIYVKEINKEKK